MADGYKDIYEAIADKYCSELDMSGWELVDGEYVEEDEDDEM